MPSVSRPQHNFMEMIAHGGKPRKGKGPPVAVAKEYVAADKARGKRALRRLPASPIEARAKPKAEY